MKFIEIDDGFLNLSFVEKITQEPLGNTIKNKFYDARGQKIGESVGDLTRVDLNATIVPANPGYVLVRVFIDEDGPCVIEDDIIAFHLDGSGDGPIPYTVDGSAFGDSWAIRSPSGKLGQPMGMDFDNVQHMVEIIQKRKVGQ
jgi:hypothetical protein